LQPDHRNDQAVQNLTVTNAGTAVLLISGLLQGSQPEFAQAGTSSTLSPGATFTAAVRSRITTTI
jgi:hypothetical protein